MSKSKIVAMMALVAFAMGILLVGDALAGEEKEKALQQYNLEYLFSYTAKVDRAFDIIGPAADGIRYTLYTTGGEVSGPKIRGKIRRGQNCAYLRTDGVEIDNIRRAIETEDGALIVTLYVGVSEWGEDGYQTMIKTQGKGFPRFIPMRGSVQLQTGHPKYLWLNRLHCLEIGQWDIERWEAICDVYAVR